MQAHRQRTRLQHSTKAMAKKTFEELTEANSTYMNMLSMNPLLENTKFGYAWKRFFKKNLEKPFNEYNALVTDTRIEHALANKETGEIFLDQMPGGRGFKYNKEGLKSVIAAERKLKEQWSGKEYEVEPYMCTGTIPELSESQTEAFQGLIIPCPKSTKSK